MIINGDCLEEMKKMRENSIDFIVTDPPYGLHFMGKDWDHFKRSNFDENGKHKHLENSSVHLTTRDVRKIASGNSHAGTYDNTRNDEFQEFIKLVGKEMIRVIKPGGHVAMFGSPRRHHRQMSGLEDSGFEIRDVIMWVFGSGFPKSHNKFGLDGYGTALKPAYEPIIIAMKPLDGTYVQNYEKWGLAGINIDESRIETAQKLKSSGELSESNHKGRWPANVIFDEEAAESLDEQTGVLKNGKYENNFGGASRFFYCAKTSPGERGEFNNHPTVKPISLMKYLIKLLAPPCSPVLLDPFAGSGSTLLACKELGIECIGIEKERQYCDIAEKRLENEKKEMKERQMDMFECFFMQDKDSSSIMNLNQKKPEMAQQAM